MNHVSSIAATARVWPVPRTISPAPDLDLRGPLRVEAPPLFRRPAALLKREAERLFGPGLAGPGLRTRIVLDAAALPHPEEYEVSLTASIVRVRAHDEKGAFWGVHTLVSLLEGAQRSPSGWRVPGATVRDWPADPGRAFMIEGAWTQNADDYRRNLDLLARLKIRTFALEFGPQVILDLDPKIATGGRYSKAEARSIIEHGRSLGMEPIGYLNLLGHLDRAYQKPPFTDHGGIMIHKEETYPQFVYPILAEMLEVYGPIKAFHCGMDEAWDLFTWYSQQGMDGAALLAAHVRKVRDFLHTRGVKLVIWHDMFIAPSLAKELAAPVGPANGGPPQNSAGAIGRLPKDVILDYWFYDPEEAYPALDYLGKQGFEVWASPWQTPFGLVRYAQARRAPTMGTLWADPPGCFASPTFSPVTALYAQAAWDPSAAPSGRNPEPAVAGPAQRATARMLWSRRTLRLLGSRAVLAAPNGRARPASVAWPRDSRRIAGQYGGVPFDFRWPARFDPLARDRRSLERATSAATVLLPGGEGLALDGVNTGRGEDQLILYTPPRARTGTNVYGVEVSVSAAGEVSEVSAYGAGDHAIPAGGFILSAHEGTNGRKASRLRSLRPGDLLAVLDGRGRWIGGAEPTRISAALPNGETLAIDDVNGPRSEDSLVLYQDGKGGARTGTNPYGVEVIVRAGIVAEVRPDAGDSPIPRAGYVLSAHQGLEGTKARALRALKVGDRMRLILDRAGGPQDLDALLRSRTCRMQIGSRCHTAFLAMTTEMGTRPFTLLGYRVARYADGSVDSAPIFYGVDALAAKVTDWPQALSGNAWLVERGMPPQWCLVSEWRNPRPQTPIVEVTVEPTFGSLEAGLHLLAATFVV